MKINQIQYFLVIAETGSYTEAAYELYISQSSLSKQIIALEKELGFALFDRSKRRIELTDAGIAFRRHARQLNETYLAMQADISSYKTSAAITILSLPFIAQYGITAWLARFRQAYPHFKYTLGEREPHPVLRALDNHSCDLAFVRDNYLDAERYDSLVIAADEMLAVVSKHHRLSGREVVSLGELAGENFILNDPSSLLDKVVRQACQQEGFTPYVSFTSLRAESIISQVSASNGVAIIMRRVFEHRRYTEVIGIPLEQAITSNVVLTWLRESKLSRPARTFVDFMRDVLVQDA